MKEIILIAILLAGIVAIFLLGKPKKKKEEDIQPVTRQKLTTKNQLDIVEATVKSLVICKDDDEKQGGALIGWMFKDRYYIESIVATIRASVDMEDFTEDDIKQNNLNKTITIKVPCPTLGEANFPQEKNEIIWKKGGKFEPEEVEELRKQKQKEINQDKKIRDIVLMQAKQNAENFFKSRLIYLGFNDANINFKKGEKTEQ